MNDADLEQTAYHEAGHAIMALLHGGHVQMMTIEPDWDDGPDRYGEASVHWDQSGWSRKQFQEVLVRVALSGPVAEMIYRGDPYHPAFVPEWKMDWEQAWEAAHMLHPVPEARIRYLEACTKQVYHEFQREDIWQAIASLADELLAHETLDHEQIRDAITPWIDLNE